MSNLLRFWNEYPATATEPITVEDTLAQAGFIKKPKPLTDEQIDCAYQKIWRDRMSDFQTPFDWAEAGIRYAERAHGIGGEL